MKIQNIIIRREYKTNEFRTPLIPSDCKKCFESGMIIYVETSAQRCIPDEEYEKNGCIIIEDFTVLGLPKTNTLVIGLKELDYNNSKILPWCHLYFTHIFKNQIGSEEIIKKRLYHSNIKTPKWFRYFIQTPELHSIHHQFGVHKYNFGDIPE